MSINVDYKEINRNSYDATANEYLENTVKLQTEQKAKSFISHLPVQTKILDLGCGPGKDALYFIEQGYQVVGAPTYLRR